MNIHTHKHLLNQKHKTRKKNTRNKQKITGKDLGMQNGWHNILVYGTPYQIGYAHGYLLATRVIECIELMKQYISLNKYTYAEYMNIAKTQIQPTIESVYPYLHTEMQGITDGVNARSSKRVTYDDILTWNSYMSIDSIQLPTKSQRCTAFIATGNLTSTGEIVMGHNTNYDYAFAPLSNVVMHISPSEGHGFIMQTMPGLICSTMDWFICTSGIIGCETTINTKETSLQPGRPYFGRIRECMQFGNTLDDYARIMTTDRSNDYNCNWFFGNIHTNEIMVCELSEPNAFIQKTSSGAYYASNNVVDNNIKYKSSIYYTNESNAPDNRAERLEYLLMDKYAGKLNTINAKKILSDHYDSYLGKMEKSPRTICTHDEYETNRPYGAIDSKVINSRMAKKMAFWGKFGAPCGTHFNAYKFMKNNPNTKAPLLKNIRSHKWTILQSIA